MFKSETERKHLFQLKTNNLENFNYSKMNYVLALFFAVASMCISAQQTAASTARVQEARIFLRVNRDLKMASTICQQDGNELMRDVAIANANQKSRRFVLPASSGNAFQNKTGTYVTGIEIFIKKAPEVQFRPYMKNVTPVKAEVSQKQDEKVCSCFSFEHQSETKYICLRNTYRIAVRVGKKNESLRSTSFSDNWTVQKN